MTDWSKYDRLREPPIAVRLTKDDLAWLKRYRAAEAEAGRDRGFSAIISGIVHEHRVQSEQLQPEQLQSASDAPPASATGATPANATGANSGDNL